MGLLERFRSRRAIKAYARRLPRLLYKDYGGADAYTPAQVQKTIERHGLDPVHSAYAIAMFCERGNFEEFRSQSGASISFDAACEEIACQYFAGASFSTSDFSSESFGADGAHHSGGPGHSDAGSGDSGSN